VDEMTLHSIGVLNSIGVLKFYLCLIKLSQVQLRQELVSLVSPISVRPRIISRPLSVLAFLGRGSIEIVVADIFLSTSTTSQPQLIQVPGFFQDFFRHEFCYVGGLEAASSFAHAAPSRLQKENNDELLKDLYFISFCKIVLVRNTKDNTFEFSD
jgi:hypothetical protein